LDLLRLPVTWISSLSKTTSAKHNIERALLLAGHRAEVAADGAVALEQAAAFLDDLILLDLLLPTLDGFSLLKMPGGRDVARRFIVSS
jgi:DNA-binding response OmpR family regulator